MNLCFGDSITKGRPGVTYLKYVKNKDRFINFGLGSDTLPGMTERIAHILKKPEYHTADTFIIGIGANDVLLPYLKSYSRSWSKVTAAIFLRGSVPSRDEDHFRSGYEKLLQMLKDEGKRIIVFGIPFFETPEDDLNKKAERYNGIISDLCAEFSVPFVDIAAHQREIKEKQNNTGACFFSKDSLRVLLLAILTTTLPFADQVSKKRGLAVTVDGVHMNKVSARILARLIEEQNIS